MSIYIEKYAPVCSGILVAAVLYYFRESIAAKSIDKSLSLSILFSSMFDWSAIQTGFLFGIFGFIAGKNDGFIKEIQETPQMQYFHRYQKTAIFLGFILTFSSIFLMVSNFSFASSDSWKFYIFCFWCALSMWAFFAFVRVAYIFGIIIRVRDRSRVRG